MRVAPRRSVLCHFLSLTTVRNKERTVFLLPSYREEGVPLPLALPFPLGLTKSEGRLFTSYADPNRVYGSAPKAKRLFYAAIFIIRFL